MTSRFPLWCVIALAACVPPNPSQATPEPLDPKSAVLLKREYLAELSALHESYMEMARAIPAAEYAWRPAPRAQSVSDVLMQIVTEWYYACPVSVGSKPPADFDAAGQTMMVLRAISAKPEVLAQLEKSWAHCREAISSVDPAQLITKHERMRVTFARVVLTITGDQHEYLGQLIAYGRAIGVKQPWEK